jgi:hypothetical protein
MNRTIRLATMLRWAIVSMHTAMVVSLSYCPVASTASGSAGIWPRGVTAILMLADLPVTLLTLFPALALSASSASPTLRTVLFLTVFVVLGGIQWYLIAGLLARTTCGLQASVEIVSKRFGVGLALSVVLVGGCALLPWGARLQQGIGTHIHGPYTPPPVAFSGNTTDLHQTVVVPTLDTPVPEGKNVVWCGTVQLAWKHLVKDVLREPAKIQGAEEVVSRLNKAQLGEEDLPPDSYLATAGFAKDGIVEKVKSEMQRRFQEEVDIDALAPNDILAYAYLEASAAFTTPFFENRGLFRFVGSDGVATQVSSFGIEERHEYAYEELREQIDVLYSLRQNGSHEGLEEFVVDLCRDSSRNQIVVACVPRKATLLETLADVEKKIQGSARSPYAEYQRRFGIRDVLLVPNLNWEVRHNFAELEGGDKRFTNAGFGGYYIAKAMQTIRFRLDRSGAELASEAQHICKPSATFFVLDRPFLIFMRKREAERPFFVMWVDNAELLCKP